ncbi:MAG: hypothetical protein DRQ78_01205 [Epsilonproteobacteria bacterium]|nr:MAG: hypothetical protein DRQ78_01205 [Campylobacterota bacterium]
MMFDIGAVDKKQVQKEFELNIGNVVTFDYPSEQNGDRVIAKSLDDRAGVAILLETLDFIKNTSFDYDIYIGASSQEEVGLRGARTSAYKINPDLAIVVDVSPSNDLPTDEQTGTLGKGTILRHKDSCYLTDKYIIKYIRDLSTKHNIKIQDYFGTGCTNAGILHLSNNGIKTIPLGLLARGLHTGSSIIDMNDYEETKKLLKEVLTDLNIKTINKIKGNT